MTARLGMMVRLFAAMTFVLLSATFFLLSPASVQAQQAETPQARHRVVFGYAKCAHCFTIALTPELTDRITIEPVGFNTASDALTALVSGSIDVAQLTYLHFITALDKGFDVVAISGHINGGSAILAQPKLALAEGDWTGFRTLVLERKAQGNPLKVAASRGSAQDVHLRGELLLNGIDVSKDVQFVNIPNPADHAAALQRSEAEIVCTVEPFASQMKLAGIASPFALPYRQAAGKLTSLIVTRSNVISRRPQDVQDTVDAVVKLVDKIDNDPQLWVDAIVKHTGLSRPVAQASLSNLYPDYRMYRGTTAAIAAMMRDMKYVSRDVSTDIQSHMDYRFLTEATHKAKEDIGY
jgi:ABC-type nitrate/sulfonate/bicarbonate transport system substrate-binding protein